MEKNGTNLYLIEGDITQIPTPAIMTAINSEGLWFGGVDRAIQRVAGNMYHGQAANKMPLSNLQTIVTRGAGNHGGKFKDVVFVVDDLQSPLDHVIYNGLEAAHREGYDKILIPTIRMGVMAGVVEKTPQEAVQRINVGIEKFMGEYGENTSLKDITWVVYNDPETSGLLRAGLVNKHSRN